MTFSWGNGTPAVQFGEQMRYRLTMTGDEWISSTGVNRGWATEFVFAYTRRNKSRSHAEWVDLLQERLFGGVLCAVIRISRLHEITRWQWTLWAFVKQARACFIHWTLIGVAIGTIGEHFTFYLLPILINGTILGLHFITVTVGFSLGNRRVNVVVCIET